MNAAMTGFYAQFVAAYRACGTYRDRGDAVFESNGERSTTHFRTRFVRTGRFRFDAEESTGVRLVVSWTDLGARWWTSAEAQPIEAADLATALLEMTERHPSLYLSASLAVLSVVPPLLLPALDDLPLGRLGLVEDWQVGQRAVGGDGRTYVEINGVQHVDAGPGLAEMSKWIDEWVGRSPVASPPGSGASTATALSVALAVDPSSNLIRRFTVDGLIVSYWPEFDAPIDDAEFVLAGTTVSDTDPSE